MKPMSRRTSYLLERVLSNMGFRCHSLARALFEARHERARREALAKGFYLDAPEEFDDPYRFFRW